MGSKRPSVFKFSEARLFCLQGSSYIELSKPISTALPATLNCCYCSKNTIHEHDIKGKVKFNPRAQNLLVSLIQNVEGQEKSSKNEVSEETKKSADKSLEIVPVEKVIVPVKRVETFPGSKTVKLCPEILADEQRVCTSFADELMSYLESEDQSPFMRAAKENESIHVIKAVKKSELSRSILKVSTKFTACVDCVICRCKTFKTLPELKSHFEGGHNCALTIKTIPASLDQPAFVQKTPSASSIEHRCDVCSTSFESDVALISHENEVHAGKGDVKFQCEVCLQYFKSLVSFKKHKAEFHRNKMKSRDHACHLCQKRFLKIQHLNDHISRHFGAKPHQCNLCDKKYTSQFSLKLHKMNSHGVGEKPICEICDKSFCNQTLKNRHILEKHKRDRRLECGHCGHVYLRKDNLVAHVRSAHSNTGNDVQPICQLCQKTFGSKSTLTDHLRICHGILPWNVLPMTKNGQDLDVERLEKDLAGSVQCKFCEQTFLPTEMESHLRFSHGVMPVRPGGPTERSITEAAEALLRTLTPQPDYLLRCLTPLPMETLDEIIMKSALNKD